MICDHTCYNNIIFVLDDKIIYNKRFTITAKLLYSCYQLKDALCKSSKRKFKIVSPDAPLIKKVAQINWEACFIRQLEENNSPIVSPFKSRQCDSDPKRSTCYKVAENLRKFCEYSDSLPTVLQIHLENYKTNQDLVSQFVKQKAVFHNTCMNKYGSYNFKRKVKKKINTSSSYSIEPPRSSGRILSTPNYSDNFVFFLRSNMMQLTSILVKFCHWINVLEKLHKS